MNWVKAIPLLVLTVGLWISWIILLAGVVSVQATNLYTNRIADRLLAVR